MINKLFIILLALSSCFSMNAQLNKIERKIVNNIDANTNQAIDLLKEVVNINSGSLNLEGVKLVGEKFAQQYRELGFDVKWIPGESFERSGHMVATHVRPNVPKILLIGHLDTVFEPESSFQKYKIIDGHIMHGPGALDMKGGNVIMFLALKALKEAKVLDKLSIEVFLVGDEELSGRWIIYQVV